ncbi:MAG: Asp-tRNA(Asn)/Glu-tRNA(Gln) amidotransferase subunit GatA [Deltaproteobacteria bacterium]|nr:Asp-tRNA(Asn)/Glu-tRNA(Gln) amidotransferase subunit GatA [Deltaproteobacteria bacterium]MBN2671040.1 Asp-tRNA(Asn)/Glu-tRNA(Gln) amidotransferase subunit GatA [Deltaproteobacteria bacterium]
MTLLQGWKGVLSDDRTKENYKQYVTGWEEKIHSLLEFDIDRNAESAAAGPLAGVPFAVKDNIAVKNFNLTCGSKILETLNSPYTATAVERLQAAGARVVGKTNLDEFGMGSSTDNSALAQTNNPWNLNAVAGGSSGGSAAAVAAGLVPFALGSDTGGSVRQPASFCGCLGLKPTYGSVSRFGLVAYASSLEVIGVLAKEVDVMEAVYDIIAGRDEKDQSSVARPEVAPHTEIKKVGVLRQIAELSPAIEAAYQAAIEQVKSLGLEVVEIDIPALDYVVPAYYTIATAEASANLARYTGIRYGHRTADDSSMEQMVAASRNEGFGDEVKLRILLGTYVLRSGFQDQYYIRAQKIRTAIRNGFDEAFQAVDVMLTPVFPTQSFLRGEGELTPFQQKLADKFTAAANLAGIPALTYPTGVAGGLPTAMQLLAPDFAEHRMFELVRRLTDEQGNIAPVGYDEGWRK